MDSLLSNRKLKAARFIWGHADRLFFSCWGFFFASFYRLSPIIGRSKAGKWSAFLEFFCEKNSLVASNLLGLARKRFCFFIFDSGKSWKIRIFVVLRKRRSTKKDPTWIQVIISLIQSLDSKQFKFQLQLRTHGVWQRMEFDLLCLTKVVAWTWCSMNSSPLRLATESVDVRPMFC